MCDQDIKRTGTLKIEDAGLTLHIPFMEDSRGRVTFHKDLNHGLDRFLKHLTILCGSKTFHFFKHEWIYDDNGATQQEETEAPEE